MGSYEVATLTELSDDELDLVAGGSLVGPISISVNVANVIGNQFNLAVLSRNLIQTNTSGVSIFQIA